MIERKNVPVDSEAVEVRKPATMGFPVVLNNESKWSICVMGAIPAFLREAHAAFNQKDYVAMERSLSAENLDRLSGILEQDPPRLDLAAILIQVLAALGRSDEAMTWCKAMEKVAPFAWVYWQMSELLDRDHRSEALGLAEKAVKLDPGNHIYQYRWAVLMCDSGYLEQGLQYFEELRKRRPRDSMVLHGWLWFKLYSEFSCREDFYQGYRCSVELLEPVCPYRSFVNVPDPQRRLRIGIISPDFYNTSAAKSMEAVLDGLSSTDLDVYAYSKVKSPDRMTEHLRSKFAVYRDVKGRTPLEIAQTVREDQIDILMAFAGYVREHGLDVLRYRPAPIQMDFQGISTTGLPEVDYRVTDQYLDGPEDLRFYTEESVFLPGGWLCFCPPAQSPLIELLPALRNGYVTFGSFNNFRKITDNLLRVWAEILRGTPNSHLILKAAFSDDQPVNDLYKDRLKDWGVEEGRIEILNPMLDHYDHLNAYNRVDLSLDTYPFNGACTSFESLWMGVPVVSWAGETFVSRSGLSILSHVDLPIFCAHSEQEYIEKAIAFARQLDSLTVIRKTMRERLLQSPLCDPQRMGRELEQAFREMWRKWCATQ